MCVVDVMLDESATIGHLFTLGEIGQLCPRLTPPRVFMLVQSLIAAPAITSVGQLNVAHVLCCAVCNLQLILNTVYICTTGYVRYVHLVH